MKRQFLSVLFVYLLVAVVAGTQVNAQANKGPKYGQDSVTCITNISLYREFFKQWKSSKYQSGALHDAVVPWRYVFNSCPAARQSTYVDGIKMYQYFVKGAEDETSKQALIDTLMMIYDQRIQYFGKKGANLGRKGVDLYKYRPEATEDIYGTLKESVELLGNKSTSAALVYYFRATTKMAKEGKIDNSVIVDTYDQVMNIVDYNMANNPKKKAAFANSKGNIDLTFEPYANCADLTNIYKKKFDATPDDVELLKKITKILIKTDKRVAEGELDCTSQQLFFDASVRLHELEPSPESAFNIGRMLLKKKEYTQAVEYLEQSTQMEDVDRIADVYLLLSDTYRQLKQYSKSRSAAYKAIENRPGDGNPYIIIGDLYAASAKDCGGNDLTNKVAYWVAVDKYYKAKSVDPEIAEVANQRIAAYSKHFPPLETIFFHDLKEGEPYKVECWINETTKVRAAK